MKIRFCIIILFLLSMSTHATWGLAFHERIVFIGSNPNAYYFFSITRVFDPNNAHAYSEITSICKCNFNGKRIDEIQLASKYYSDDDFDGKFTQSDLRVKNDNNVFHYLQEENVSFVFPSFNSLDLSLALSDNNLIHVQGKDKIVLADWLYIKKFLPTHCYFDRIENGKIKDVFEDKVYYFVILEMGYIDTSIDWQQVVIVLAKKNISELLAKH